MESKGEVQILHFRTTGEFVTNHSRNLFIEGDVINAMKTLVEGLVDFPENMAVEVISGRKALVGTNEFNYVDDNTTEIHGIPLSFENMWSILAVQYLDSMSSANMFKARIIELAPRMNAMGAMYRTSKYESVYNDYEKNCFYSLISDRTNYRHYTEKLKGLSDNLTCLGKLLNKGFSDLPLDMMEQYDIGVKRDYTCSRSGEKFEYYLNADDAHYKEDIKTLREIKSEEERFDELREFVDAQIKIDDKLKEPIKPNDILDMNVSGWLAPNGDWYGLDGHIGNNLHIQLANAIHEAGLIEMPDKNSCNFDFQLLKTGWIKVHKHNIYFEGNRYKLIASKEQFEKLYVYGQHLTPPILNLGYRHTTISAVIVREIGSEAFNLYFDL